MRSKLSISLRSGWPTRSADCARRAPNPPGPTCLQSINRECRLKSVIKSHWLVFGLLFVLGCAHPPVQVAPWYQNTSGMISEINGDDFWFVVSSQDSGSDVTRIFQFKTDASTRYQNAVGFRDLTIGDEADVDFIQNSKGAFVATHVALKKKMVEDEPQSSEPKKSVFLE